MAPTVILIRHAQALHNVDHKYPLRDSSLPDPVLSELGREQCEQLREALQRNGPAVALAQSVELIVSSPMRRTLETTRLGLGWLMDRGVPVVVSADWQENSDAPCDVGTPVDKLAPSFPDFSFAGLDPTYPSKTGRYAFDGGAILRRGADCRAWLRARPEKVIAVVSHSGFLRVGVSKRGFGNADYRIFDFAAPKPGDDDDDDRLLEWPETQERGGGLGRSMKGYFGVESQPWPKQEDAVGAADPADPVRTSDEAVAEKPTS